MHSARMAQVGHLHPGLGVLPRQVLRRLQVVVLILVVHLGVFLSNVANAPRAKAGGADILTRRLCGTVKTLIRDMIT